MAKPNTAEEELLKYLTDAYSLEQQALAQLRQAPELAGEAKLQASYLEHLAETELQAEMVRERLEAHGGSPSRVKDAVMKLGGKAFLLFARVQPDTPGKLAVHAYSYEALEWAFYEILIRMAQRAGDHATVPYARTIRDQERAMMERLARGFDAAVEASLEKLGPDEIASALRHYLADAHALEMQSVELLEKGQQLAGEYELERIYREHRSESEAHARWIEERLEDLGSDKSVIKDAVLRLGALNWSLFFKALSDTPAKLAIFVYAVEHLEIAGLELLRRVALRASDPVTADLCDRILKEEHTMAERVALALDRAFEASLVADAAQKNAG